MEREYIIRKNPSFVLSDFQNYTANFVHKRSTKSYWNHTNMPELSLIFSNVKHIANPKNVSPVISAMHAVNPHMHNVCC